MLTSNYVIPFITWWIQLYFMDLHHYLHSRTAYCIESGLKFKTLSYTNLSWNCCGIWERQLNWCLGFSCQKIWALEKRHTFSFFSQLLQWKKVHRGVHLCFIWSAICPPFASHGLHNITAMVLYIVHTLSPLTLFLCLPLLKEINYIYFRFFSLE